MIAYPPVTEATEQPAPAATADSANFVPPVAALRALPAPADNGEILDAFLNFILDQGLQLYEAQEEATLAAYDDRHVVLATPTGSGKSMVATAVLFRALCQRKRGFYTCPVKALVNEKFFDLCRLFGPENVGLMTGDASVNRNAPILCGTAEILANLSVHLNQEPADVVVMDEFHYYGDQERGIAWQLPLLSMPRAQFLLMSATLGDMSRIIKHIEDLSGKQVVHVHGMQRPVPLHFTYADTPLHETVSTLCNKDRAPIYLVNFTQRACAEQAQNLTSLDLASKEQKIALRTALAKERFPSPYGKEIQKFLRVGLGIHHAGLLPRYRRLVERLAQQGLLKVISGTDTLGVGVNIPIRTVLFTQLCKFDGEKDGILRVRDFQQIAGRAGRKGFDDVGYVFAQAPAHVIENQKLATKGKKFVRRQPPKKGFVHFDEGTFEKLQGGTPEALSSRFHVDHGLLLSLLQSERGDPRRGGGYGQLLHFIGLSHESEAQKKRHKRDAAQCFRTLRHAGLIDVVRGEKARNPYPIVHGDLQEDFSLNQTLGLYLIEALDRLDPQEETYAFDVLALVESILENPRPILMAQLDQIKGQKLAEMKAEGKEYEERMEELDKLEWPKPLRDFIYETFNDFRKRHPWVGESNISPKGVAREFLYRNLSFNEYVRDLGVGRSEGVLLRYMSDVYRALDRNIPSHFKTEGVYELIFALDANLRMVDASLIEEWQALTDPAAAAAQAAAAALEAPATQAKVRIALADDPRALLARVRSELHRLLYCLAHREYGEALEGILPDDASGQPWTEERLAQQVQPFFDLHGAMNAGPQARTPRQTTLNPQQDKIWEATQTLLDPNEDNDHGIFVVIDLTAEARAGLAEDAPILTLERVGI